MKYFFYLIIIFVDHSSIWGNCFRLIMRGGSNDLPRYLRSYLNGYYKDEILTRLYKMLKNCLLIGYIRRKIVKSGHLAISLQNVNIFRYCKHQAMQLAHQYPHLCCDRACSHQEYKRCDTLSLQ